MHRSKRRKHASEAHDPSKAAPQGTKSTEDHLDSDDEAPVETVDAAAAYSALLGGLRADGVTNGSAKSSKKSPQKPAAALASTTAGLSASKKASQPRQEPKQQEAAHQRSQTENGHSADKSNTAATSKSDARQGKASRKAEEEQQNQLPAVDYSAHHFDRVLSDGEVPELRSSAAKFRDAEEGVIPQAVWRGASCLITGEDLQEAPACLAEAGVQSRLITRWREVHSSSTCGSRNNDAGSDERGAFVSSEQRAFFGFCSSWKDILLTQRPYLTRAHGQNAIVDAYLLHVINHVNTSALRIKKHNDALKAGKDSEAPRDQGFCRAKVLVLLPMRSTALKVVSRLCELAQKETRADSIQNKGRFLEEFGSQEGEDDEGDGAVPGQRSSKKAGQDGAAAGKPAEHAALFGGNCDDHFRLGIKVTRGAVKLYCDFMQSDIIVASPIALATKLSEEAEEGGPADFLSSIEVVVVDRADVLLMQNWAHVVTVFQALNKLPEAQHGTDIMRVREPLLAGQGALYRQSIVMSSLASAEMNALLNRTCANWAGKIKLKVTHQGVLGQAVPQLRQLFERLPAASAAADADTRFEHFCAYVWPQIKESSAKGQLIFVASYYDYVRLRNFLKEQEVQVAALSEYAPPKEAARARSLFMDGRLHVALLTERSHFYNRARVRGVKDLLFYQLPQHAHFYLELVDMLAGRDDMALHATVKALFTKTDAIRLEPIVGSMRSQKMLKGGKGTFLFC